ncbi:MAG: hypothetical protein GY804_12785 [Alphaproteobacteria bacterium]|nr:hypothetical protein [Alphaproteobacteria bacterium]
MRIFTPLIFALTIALCATSISKNAAAKSGPAPSGSDAGSVSSSVHLMPYSFAYKNAVRTGAIKPNK